MITLLPNLDTDTSADWWLGASEWTLVISAIILAIGIVGEWPESDTWRDRALYKIAKAAVLFGVIGELIGDGGVFLASAKLQELQQTAIQTAQTDAANANDRAGQANKAAGEANERAAKIEAAAAWRILTPDQLSRFVTSLSASKHTVQIAFMKGDPESQFLELQFADAVHRAGWEYGSWEVHLGRVVFFGLAVLDDKPDGEAGRALSRALSDAGVGADQIAKLPGQGYEGDGGYQQADVTLLIGSKFPPGSILAGNKPTTP